MLHATLKEVFSAAASAGRTAVATNMVINKQSRHEMPFRRIICTPTSAFAKKEKQ
jgi:hypothetical protein